MNPFSDSNHNFICSRAMTSEYGEEAFGSFEGHENVQFIALPFYLHALLHYLNRQS